jgi:serine/threonine-protein kinase
MTALVGGLVVGGIAVWSLMDSDATTVQLVKRLVISLPSNDYLVAGRSQSGSAVVISPDGSKVVYVGSHTGAQQLYLRSMDELEPTPLRGTEGASQPVFSPDGRWVAFLVEGSLKKVSLEGGGSVTLCDVHRPVRGLSWWGEKIIFALVGSGLAQVSASGGTPQELFSEGSQRADHRWPEILPNGKAVLFHTRGAGGVTIQSLETGERKALFDNGLNPCYVSSGYIVFYEEGALRAAPFNQDRLEVTGPPVPVLEGIQMVGTSAAQFDVSNEGTLAYIPGQSLPQAQSILVWVDREGVEESIDQEPRAYFAPPRLSPDGQRIAFTLYGTAGEVPDIWILEQSRGALTRFTFGEGDNMRPIWSPDGQRIIFGSSRIAGIHNLFSKPADGSGTAEQLTTGAYQVPTSLSPDGKTIVFRQLGDANWDIGILRLEDDRKSEAIIQTPFDEHTGMLSPDGRWLSYVSNESGQDEIYVRPFPNLSRKFQISTEGGSEPLWARNGKELFYRNGEKMMSVTVTTEPDFIPGKPVLLFEGPYELQGTNPISNYDISSDGQRFLMVKLSEDSSAAPRQINIVLNWFDELKRLVPIKE